MKSSLLRHACVLAGACAVLAGAPGAATAATRADNQVVEPVWTGERETAVRTLASALTCEMPVVSPQLAPFGDDSLYFHAPGGNFEGLLTGWRSYAASQVLGQSPFGFGLRSLKLNPGSTVVTPRFCVDERFPHFRFSLKGASTRTQLEVSVVYPDLAGPNVRTAYLGVPGTSWGLSPQVALEPNFGQEVAGGREVALRFRVLGSAAVTIDDVLVDPKLRY